MKINGKDVYVHNPVKHNIDDNSDTITVSFMIGKTKLDKVELVFKEKHYVDGKEVTDN